MARGLAWIVAALWFAGGAWAGEARFYGYRVEEGTYREGLKLWRYLPLGGDERVVREPPLVLWFHGGGWSGQLQRLPAEFARRRLPANDLAETTAATLALQGFAVLVPQYHVNDGSGDYCDERAGEDMCIPSQSCREEGACRLAVGTAEDMEADLIAALEEARKMTSGPLFVGGVSAGGHLALYALSRLDAYAAEVRVLGGLVFSAPTDLASMQEERGLPWLSELVMPRYFGGDYERWSPGTPHVPVWLYHGAEDAIAPVADVRAYAAEHEAVTLTVAPGLGHGDLGAFPAALQRQAMEALVAEVETWRREGRWRTSWHAVSTVLAGEVRGDVDRDGDVDLQDAGVVASLAGGEREPSSDYERSAADYNRDARIDEADVEAMSRRAKKP